MAATIYELRASNQSVNQGYYGIPIQLKRFRAMIITDTSFRILPGDFANLKTFMQAAVIKTDPYTRAQVIGTIQEATAANSSPIKLTYTYGLEQQPYDGQYAMDVFFADNDLARQQLRQQYNGSSTNRLVILCDEDYNFAGTKDDTGVFRGFTPSELRGHDIALDMGVGVKQGFYVSFADSKEFNNGNLLVQPTNVNANNLKMIANVTLQILVDIATRVVSLAFMVEGSNLGTNLAERFATILAANPSLLVGTNHVTGATLTMSSAVAGVINGQHVITYTIAATNYPTTGQSIDLTLADPTTLATAGLMYYETPQTLNIIV